MATYNENENPFAFQVEKTEARRTGPVFTDYENPFAYPGAHSDTTIAPETRNHIDPNELNTWRLVKYRRWNIILRISTASFCLAAAILVLTARQTSSDVPIDDGTTATGTATYKFNSSFRFFMYVNAIVFVYALLLCVSAFVTGRKGVIGRTTPTALMWATIALNFVATAFLLLAFAASVAVEVVGRHGLSLGGIIWIPICKYFGTFCMFNEIALALSAAGYVCLAASTCIDGYFIYLNRGSTN